MPTSDVVVETADGPMRLYEATPAGAGAGNGRGVVVVQEAFGVNEHIEDVTRRFAALGYHAVAPELFHRAGGGTAPYDDFAQVMPKFAGLTDEGLVMDVDAAVAHLADAGISPSATGVVGFCMGGRVTFLVALERALGAAVGFYGGGIVTTRFPQFPALVDRVGELQTPWLGLFGDLDGSIPVEDVEQLRSALSGAPVPAEVVRYPEADHGFHCDARPSYHERSATDAWSRTLAWFDQHLRS